MKKLSLLKQCILVALLAMMTGSLWAYDFSAPCSTGQTLYYNIIDATNHYVELTCPGPANSSGAAWQGFDKPTGNIVLPSSVQHGGVSYTVTRIGNYTFYWCNELTGTLSIPNTVTEIAYRGFSHCSGFTGTLTIPNTVIAIGEEAFVGCSGFTGPLVLPNSVTTIGRAVFSNCPGFTSITFPDNLITISYSAFRNCSGLNSLTLPNNLDTISSYAFYGCTALTSFNPGPNLSFIGYQAFRNCYSLSSVTLPDHLSNLGMDAFSNCVALTSITIPANLTYFGSFAFDGCTGLNSVTVESSTIGMGAFYGCTNITSLTLGPGVSSIDDNAFSSCAVLTEIWAMPNTPPTLGSNVFGNVPTDATVHVPCRSVDAYRSASGWSRFTNYQVDCLTNHWTPVYEGLYSQTAVIIAVIQIEGVEQYSDHLELGIFCGDECRGTAIADYFEPTGRYIVYANVYGEDGHVLTFRLYDHSIQQEIDLTSYPSVSFIEDGYGLLLEPLEVNFTSSQAVHNQHLTSGWNWWSTYIEQEGINGLQMLENSLGTNGIRIQGKNGSVDSYTYQGNTSWYGNLNAINNEQMFKIRTNAACDIVITGEMALLENHPITISNGWNWIGFPVNQGMTLDAAFANFTPESNDIIKGRSLSATYFSSGSSSMWYGNLNYLEPGQGYMYKSNNSTPKTLVYPTGRGNGELQPNITPADNVFVPADENYADNMLITAVVEVEGAELRSEDYELAAFAGDECRGSVKLMYIEPLDRYVAFLLAFGDQAEPLHFVLTDGRNMSWSSDLVTYETDGTVGTLTEPVTLHFGTLGVADNLRVPVYVYPNPSKGIFRIEGEGILKVEVMDAYGQVILSEEVENDFMQVNLGDRAAGAYLLRVVTDNGVTTKKLVKE